jgi:uncharacterized protein involved in oxidation of intracellular sulfur
LSILFILNHAPYGSEDTYNGLRLAISLARQEGVDVRIFLIGDAASAAHRGQKVPQGFYNVETMLAAILRSGGSVGVCGSCMDARGIEESALVEGSHRSSMEELTRWTMEADKVITF